MPKSFKTKFLSVLSFLLFFSLIIFSCKDDMEVVGGDGTGPGTTDYEITVTAPVNGDSLQVADSYEITWTSNIETNVIIEYSTNGGTDWDTIISDIENTGSYLWDPIPNTLTDEGKIRVYTTDGIVTDESDGYFSIIENQNKSLVLSKPNGGEVLFIGEAFVIKWVSSGIENIKIDLSTNSGSTWNNITPSYPADSSSYNWDPIPNSSSTNCLIRVTDVSADSIQDISETTFTISSPKDIQVTSPNGGEEWTGGSSQTIQWYSSQVTSVKIEYTTNNGIDWNLITASTESDGYFTWDPVPNTPSTNSKIRITDVTEGFPSDASDSVFTIAPESALNLTSPNGGEVWASGSSQDITWSSSITPSKSGKGGEAKIKKIGGRNNILNIENIKIEFSSNSGASWNIIVSSTPNDGVFTWDSLPSLNSSQCRVRISDADDGVPFDISENNFTITNQLVQEITVNSPNGGEEWIIGTNQNITWASSEINNVKIEYTTNNGINWNVIASSTPSDGFYTWTIPDAPSTNCKIRISDVDDNIPSDMSDDFFTISSGEVITLLVPNGEEIWYSGTVEEIAWSTSTNNISKPGRNQFFKSKNLVEYSPSNAMGISNVKIEFTSNGGSTWNTIVNSTENDGVFDWTVPNLFSINCKVRVSDADDGTPIDMSDNNFVITNQSNQEITVTSPNGGEVLAVGTMHDITWNSSAVANVSIEYTTNNGVNWTTIENSTPSDGIYSWQVPNFPSTNCKIRISDAGDNTPTDLSDDFFTIANQEEVTVIAPNGGEIWVSGSTQNILWSTSGGNLKNKNMKFGSDPIIKRNPDENNRVAISNVKIEFTTNSGASWSTIAVSVPNNGQYAWTIPSLNSNLCLVRISDAEDGIPVDVSNDHFTITNEIQQEITVVSPNGGEVWLTGSSQDITWNSTGVSDVEIEFTTNNGVSWTTIASNTPSDGLFVWDPVPNTPSTNCKIRITDVLNQDVTDESNATFTIAEAPEITVTSPNGGEIWMAGSNQEITWTAMNVTNVMIEFSTDNGVNWTNIIGSTANDGSFTWDPVPNTPSTNCLVRISSTENNLVNDESDNTFTITESPVINVTSPNGGEEWQAGTLENITWNSLDVSDVMIEFTTNNGVSWTTIIASTPSDGLFVWNPVPNTPSNNCKVRITDVTSSSITDESDATFTITELEELTVTSPNGGEIWMTGSSQEITWTDLNISNVKIEFTSDNGANWISVVESTPSDGSFNWNSVPNTPSSNCKIRITSVENNQVSDESDDTFTISESPMIIVSVPNGGEEWQGGTSENITWNSLDVADVMIEFTTNNGVSWSTVVASTPSDGFYTWDPIPNTPSNNCKVRITDVSNSSINDISDETFTITESMEITVTTPNGGEIWQGGSSQMITWTSSGISNVKIEFSTDNGGNWSVVVNNTPSDGTYNWNPVPNTPSTNCKVRITDVVNPSVTDESDGTFTITQAPEITVTSPNGGENWEAGSSQDITWTSFDIANVKIELTTNNGVTWTNVVSSTPSDGIYTFSPVPSTPSNNCKIRISDAADGTPFDISDATFTITPEPVIEVTSPNGGESYPAGSSQVIEWTSENIENVKIELTTNNGVSWTNIIESTNNTGSYNWSPIPDVNSDMCKVRLSDADDGFPVDESDTTFTITTGEGSITVITPNGGEEWEAGTEQQITWSSTNISNVSIELTTNNGVSWNAVATNITNTGIYFWEPVPNVPSTLCRIKVKDADGSSVEDESDELFTILPEPIVQVNRPNGGEVFVGGTSEEITWLSENIANVKIDYTTNNGANWINITQVAASIGSYTWNPVPMDSSYLCKVRIYDADDQQPSDVSNDVFTIIPPQQQLNVILPNGGETWVVGSTQEITWSSNDVSNVKIEVTTNNGVNWTEIIASTPSDGIYNWIVPNTPSNNCKIRISDAVDGTPVDQSDNTFTISNQEEITVLTPNGGEEWEAGSEQYITWTASGGTRSRNILDYTEKSKVKLERMNSSVENVKIEFSTNSGGNWTTVQASVPNTGAYLWTVPNVNSNLCRVRISDAADGIPFDVSDGNFTIFNDIPQEITVTVPNGGEDWQAGTSHSINWNSTGVSDVDIEFTTNNGVSWTTIVTNTPSDGSYQWDPIPNTPSTNCKVRIKDAVDGTPVDQSDATFTISPEPAITVTSPNGGENWQSGSGQDITWTAQNIANVKIEFTTNGGANWTTIINSTESDGIYHWEPVPNVNSSLCQVKISDADDGLPVDISDGFFTITNQVNETITVVSPNGGEVWEAGTAHNITWSATGIDYVDIELTTNNGISWTSIVDSTESSGAYEWTVPNVNSTQCLVRIKDAEDDTPSDVSNQVFTITPVQELTVEYPNGGEVITAGESFDIQWSSTGVQNVKIEYTINNGILEEDWYTLIGSTPSDGSYTTSFSIPSEEYRIRISDVTDTIPSDMSDGTFTISPQPSITVTEPNGGENWLVGETYEIRWVADNISNVRIDYTVNGGVDWYLITPSTPNDGILEQFAPSIIDSSHLCKVRVSDPNDTSFYDTSDDYFSIRNNTGKYITVVFPNGGEQFNSDSTIIWNSNGIGNVMIEYSLDNGFSWNVETASTPSDGAYRWVIGDVSSQARIRISDVTDPTIKDGSDSYFYLNMVPPALELVEPKDDNWNRNSNKRISWNGSLKNSDVYIEYSFNGKDWTVIDRVRHKTNKWNTYIWKDRLNRTGEIQIRIRDVDSNNLVISRKINVR